eukprot:s7751_g5.t1
MAVSVTPLGTAGIDVVRQPQAEEAAQAARCAAAATERNWMATFQLYRIIEQQMAYARVGIEWDPWKMAEQEAKS